MREDADVIGWLARRMVRRGLRGIWLHGAVPAGPVVWAANHHCWWDPFVALAALGRPGSPMLSPANAARYRFVRTLGGFAADEPRRGLALLRAGRSLVVYPEGELRPPGPPGPLSRGAAWLADRGGVPLVAAATRIVLRGHQSAEAYVRLSTVADAPAARTRPERPARVAAATAALASRLDADLAALDELIRRTDPRAPVPDFRPAAPGRRSTEELIGGWAR
ncbi:hypothetical protein GCM10010124_01170 [Pilimelia terevasa]|uniref:Phospholipid/glycerol acyltransferase domain-containing protein n=1 Tax=Pilimelia terevasa TaxID=53372 RepID=A0A8J3BG22_9ACTN|nr:lysophospholipid acyltransferase family protein [Pilimelia terevasa]GGK12429.1 hypothetical protein GCM10010124_01170 [Pilimelia terevasa]